MPPPHRMQRRAQVRKALSDSNCEQKFDELTSCCKPSPEEVSFFKKCHSRTVGQEISESEAAFQKPKQHGFCQ